LPARRARARLRGRGPRLPGKDVLRHGSGTARRLGRGRHEGRSSDARGAAARAGEAQLLARLTQASMTRPLRTAVIGAGMSGILSAIKLAEAGYGDVVLYEKADRLGGTWRENTYPRLSCDVPSHFYSYSFALNPEWAHRLSPRPEIQAYFQSLAHPY